MLKFDLKTLCEQVGVSFYDDELANENGRTIYRVYIAKKGGISVDECAKVSEILSPILDVKPPCAGEYSLEVSSPGLERKLFKPHHFALSLGEKVVLSLSDKSKLAGELVSADDEKIKVRDENGEIKELNLGEIKKAKTFVEW